MSPASQAPEPGPAALPAAIHACALILGEAGVLIRGKSGSGKSSLVMALLAAAPDKGLFAALVADDRVALRVAGARLLASPHPAIAGMIEQRGTGILLLKHEKVARISLLVDLLEAGPEGEGLARMPEAGEGSICLSGVTLRRLILPAGMPAETAARRVMAIF